VRLQQPHKKSRRESSLRLWPGGFWLAAPGSSPTATPLLRLPQRHGQAALPPAAFRPSTVPGGKAHLKHPARRTSSTRQPALQAMPKATAGRAKGSRHSKVSRETRNA